MLRLKCAMVGTLPGRMIGDPVRPREIVGSGILLYHGVSNDRDAPTVDAAVGTIDAILESGMIYPPQAIAEMKGNFGQLSLWRALAPFFDGEHRSRSEVSKVLTDEGISDVEAHSIELDNYRKYKSVWFTHELEGVGRYGTIASLEVKLMPWDLKELEEKYNNGRPVLFSTGRTATSTAPIDTKYIVAVHTTAPEVASRLREMGHNIEIRVNNGNASPQTVVRAPRAIPEMSEFDYGVIAGLMDEHRYLDAELYVNKYGSKFVRLGTVLYSINEVYGKSPCLLENPDIMSDEYRRVVKGYLKSLRSGTPELPMAPDSAIEWTDDERKAVQRINHYLRDFSSHPYPVENRQ